MARRRLDRIEFAVESSAAVVAAMDQLGRAHDGWINLQPEVHADDEPAPARGLTTLLLAGPVHDVPFCTWVAGKRTRQGVQPDSVGIQHAAGARVMARLTAAGLGLPEGWRLVQDHPRRGLVVSPPPGTPGEDVVKWLLDVASALSTVRLTGTWYAEVHMPR
jgi:hypothetical protein